MFAPFRARLLAGLCALVLPPVAWCGVPDSARLFLTLPVVSRPLHPFADLRLPSIAVPTLGVALSGGGARGLAQIGVLKAWAEAGIHPSFLAGTSSGSIVGGLAAAGYTADDLVRTIRTIDWDELLKLTNQTGRADIFVDQKPVQDRSIFTLRFDGFRPVLPVAVSNGQRLTNLLNELTLQAPYHATSFDDLKVAFRAVATDLNSGKRVVLRSGNLSDALRASATIPVLYAPVSLDGMALVDGGLRSNVPVDVVRDAGNDVVVAVNTASAAAGKPPGMNALETLDQVFNIMMDASNSTQLLRADLVVAPVPDRFSATDFAPIDSLLALGEAAGRASAPRIAALLDSAWLARLPPDPTGGRPVPVRAASPALARDPWFGSERSYADFARKLLALARSDAYSRIDVARDDDGGFTVSAEPRPVIRAVTITGTTAIALSTLETSADSLFPAPCSPTVLRALCERLLRVYRRHGFSLARIDSLVLVPRSDAGETDGHDETAIGVRIHIHEGRIADLRVEGNERTNAIVILREFPVGKGELFRIADAREGLAKLSGLNLFHRVGYEIEEDADPTVVIRVEERPTRLLQSFVLVDNERNAQIGLELRDDNFLGTGTRLSGSFFGGFQNRRYAVTYSTTRIFYTNLNFDAGIEYDLRDDNTFVDAATPAPGTYERVAAGVTRRVAYGARATAGLYVERFGNVTATIAAEQQSLHTIEKDLAEAPDYDLTQRVVSLGFGTMLDTQDKVPYPSEGLLLDAGYTSAQKALGSEVAFTRIRFRYDLYIPTRSRDWVFHPRVVFGYGDRTMPRTEEFRLGGLRSFIGMRENEFTGWQLFVTGLEVRARLPIQILFDTYASLRYDLGKTWEIPEQIAFDDLRHGIGFQIGIDTPIGPADFGIGRSFFFPRDTPSQPVRWGPTNLYFSIGVGLE